MARRIDRGPLHGVAAKAASAALAFALTIGLMPAFPANAFGDEGSPVTLEESASSESAADGLLLASNETSWDVSTAGDGSVTASISQEGGEATLSFEGSGAVRDFARVSDAPYVAAYGSVVTRVTVGDGITGVGAYSLSLPKLKVAVGGAALSRIADNAFEGATSLVAVDCSHCALASVGANAFGGA